MRRRSRNPTWDIRNSSHAGNSPTGRSGGLAQRKESLSRAQTSAGFPGFWVWGGSPRCGVVRWAGRRFDGMGGDRKGRMFFVLADEVGGLGKRELASGNEPKLSQKIELLLRSWVIGPVHNRRCSLRLDKP